MRPNEAAAGPRKLLLLVLIGCMSSWTACGKKGAPVPPMGPPIPAVADLSAAVEDGTARLSWTRQPEHRTVVSYDVLRAVVNRSNPPCPECPQVFEEIAKVRTGGAQAKGPEPLFLVLPLARGSDYLFKVIPVLQSGARGPDSNTVRVAGP